MSNERYNLGNYRLIGHHDYDKNIILILSAASYKPMQKNLAKLCIKQLFPQTTAQVMQNIRNGKIMCIKT